MRTPYVRALSTALLTLFLAMPGCRDREVTSYKAPKDPVPQPAVPQPAAATVELPTGHPPIGGGGNPGTNPNAGMEGAAQPAVTAGMALTWKAPAHWKAKPAGAVRKGSYAVLGSAGTEADMAVTAFPGDTGGLVANVNRWRAQVGLEPQSAAQIEASIQHVDLSSLHSDVVELAGKSGDAPVRLLGAIVPHQGQTWFFKMTGPDALVAAEKPAFMAFLQTIAPR